MKKGQENRLDSCQTPDGRGVATRIVFKVGSKPQWDPGAYGWYYSHYIFKAIILAATWRIDCEVKSRSRETRDHCPG